MAASSDIATDRIARSRTAFRCPTASRNLPHPRASHTVARSIAHRYRRDNPASGYSCVHAYMSCCLQITSKASAASA